jgi:hypothetical protein
MNEKPKQIESLQVSDFAVHPVWRLTHGEDEDELAVRPVLEIPVADLDLKLVGTRVQLANGTYVWALIGNIDSADARQTGHFLTLSVERDGSWFHLARYHDIHYHRSGPAALAKFLDLRIEEVFPIAYDLRPYSKGDVAALTGQIGLEPRERLSRAELISMAVK